MGRPTTIRLASGCALVAVLMVAVQTQRASATVGASSQSALYEQGVPLPPAPACLPGGTPLYPSSSEKTPDGGYRYNYNIDGQVSEFPVPPTSFRPDNASNAQLLEYGFPSRPTDALALAQWRADFSDYRNTGTPQICLTKKFVEPYIVAPMAGTAGTANSYNWSGTTENAPDAWVAVSGNWVQSAAGSCGCGTGNTDEASWVGLGGYYTQSLIQAGTDMYGTPSNLYAWFEYLHPCEPYGCNVQEVDLQNVTVAAGDSIHVFVSYETSSGSADCLVCSAGSCQPMLMQLNSTYYDGSSAEWIDERPMYCQAGCYKPLTNFDYNNWSGFAEDNSGIDYNIGTVPGLALTMIHANNQILAEPSNYNYNGNFTDTWYRAG